MYTTVNNAVMNHLPNFSGQRALGKADHPGPLVQTTVADLQEGKCQTRPFHGPVVKIEQDFLFTQTGGLIPGVSHLDDQGVRAADRHRREGHLAIRVRESPSTKLHTSVIVCVSSSTVSYRTVTRMVKINCTHLRLDFPIFQYATVLYSNCRFRY